jgi:ribosome-binding factor A
MTRALNASDFASDDPYHAAREKARDRKTGQLCAQVQRSLSFLLETECSDPCLQGFYIEAVLPNPNAACLLVVLRPWRHEQACDLKLVLQQLAELKGYWRTEIGNAIHRKKTPDLVFQVLLEGGAP